MSQLSALTMPKWGLTMTEGKVVGWLKAEGEAIAAGEELLEIETSKITNVMEAAADTTLLRIAAQPGTTLPIGGLLAVLGPADAASAEIDAFVAGFAVVTPAEEEGEAAAEGPAPRVIEAAGRRIRVLEQGSGDGLPVVFVHGFGGDLDSWMFVQPQLAATARTVAIDLPGHGGSGRDVGTGDAAALADAVPQRSMRSASPAPISSAIRSVAPSSPRSARAPQRVASLALIAPSGLGSEIDGGFIDGFVAAGRRRGMTELLGRLVHDPALVGRGMVEGVLRIKRLDGVAEALAAIARACFPAGRQALDLTAAIAALSVPVLMVRGEPDRVVPAAHAARLEGRASSPPARRLRPPARHMERAAEVAALLRKHTT